MKNKVLSQSIAEPCSRGEAAGGALCGIEAIGEW